jgi:hypothetical protein
VMGGICRSLSGKKTVLGCNSTARVLHEGIVTCTLDGQQ